VSCGNARLVSADDSIAIGGRELGQVDRRQLGVAEHRQIVEVDGGRQREMGERESFERHVAGRLQLGQIQRRERRVVQHEPADRHERRQADRLRTAARAVRARRFRDGRDQIIVANVLRR
jgi:hypothetical protein